MTKAEIIESVCDRVGGFSKSEAAFLVDAIFDTMKEALTLGYRIKISGFGNFAVRDKRSRRGLNPRTREAITLAPRRVVRFRPSPRLRDRLNPLAVQRLNPPTPKGPDPKGEGHRGRPGDHG